MRKLTLKQRKFTKEYLRTGNGTQAALIAYDVKDPNVAKVIASENLTKPNIEQSISDVLNRRGLGIDALTKELDSVASREIEKPLSASEKIKAIELAFKLHGKLDKNTTKLTVSLSHKLEGKSFSELKKDMTLRQEKASRLLQDLE